MASEILHICKVDFPITWYTSDQVCSKLQKNGGFLLLFVCWLVGLDFLVVCLGFYLLVWFFVCGGVGVVVLLVFFHFLRKAQPSPQTAFPGF